jgi:hypothetical protein
MCRKLFVKHVVVRNAEETRKRGIRRKQLLDELKNRRRYWNLKERGIKLHSGEDWFWKRLRICRKTDHVMNVCPYSIVKDLFMGPKDKTWKLVSSCH